MKIAVFSDVHGNTIALDAVLADIAKEEVDAFWVVGDLVALGPAPADAARKLAALPNASFVRGNTDRYTCTGDLEDLEEAMQDVVRLERYIRFGSSFSWARGALSEAGYFGWLQALPLEVRKTLPDGTRVLLVHAAPGTDEGWGITPAMTESELAALVDGIEAEIVIVGHTHVPLDREVNGVRIHNLGSVSLPKTDEHRAMWTLLTADASGYTLERRFVSYDIAAVQAAFDAIGHPFAAGLKAMFPAG